MTGASASVSAAISFVAGSLPVPSWYRSNISRGNWESRRLVPLTTAEQHFESASWVDEDVSGEGDCTDVTPLTAGEFVTVEADCPATALGEMTTWGV